MNLLVTGVAGYVGSVCAEALVQSGHTVAGLDNLSEGHREAIPDHVVFWECDLGDRQGLDRLLASTRVDAVMHFAAASLVEESVQNPSRSYLVNVAFGIHLLDAMIKHNVGNIVFSSTAAIYGEPRSVPIGEDQAPLPINPYGRSKLIFERILEEYRTCAGLRYVSLRYFNAAGASEQRGEDHRRETHLIPILLDVALGRRDDFQIYGDDYPTPDGTCIRDYVHVQDIADAHILVLDQLERLSGEVFNLGNSRGHSVREVIGAVQSVTGRRIRAIVGPRRAGDPAVLVASSQKIRRELGWRPRFSDLESIVSTAWAWKQQFPSGYAKDFRAP